jgi:hypothetical protein
LWKFSIFERLFSGYSRYFSEIQRYLFAIIRWYLQIILVILAIIKLIFHDELVNIYVSFPYWFVLKQYGFPYPNGGVPRARKGGTFKESFQAKGGPPKLDRGGTWLEQWASISRIFSIDRGGPRSEITRSFRRKEGPGASKTGPWYPPMKLVLRQHLCRGNPGIGGSPSLRRGVFSNSGIPRWMRNARLKWVIFR